MTKLRDNNNRDPLYEITKIFYVGFLEPGFKQCNESAANNVTLKGSHILLRHKTNGRRVIVPKSHKGHPIKLGTLRSIIQQAGITEDNFIKQHL
jgi:predicted RNA binding protein YcfA (HicA-like mRNA interferase family)